MFPRWERFDLGLHHGKAIGGGEPATINRTHSIGVRQWCWDTACRRYYTSVALAKILEKTKQVEDWSVDVHPIQEISNKSSASGHPHEPKTAEDDNRAMFRILGAYDWPRIGGGFTRNKQASRGAPSKE